MKLEFVSGLTYTIPHEIVRKCKTITIGYNKVESNDFVWSRCTKKRNMFRENDEALKGYTFVGRRALVWDNILNIYIETYWFIPTSSLPDCRCDPTDQKVYNV